MAVTQIIARLCYRKNSTELATDLIGSIELPRSFLHSIGNLQILWNILQKICKFYRKTDSTARRKSEPGLVGARFYRNLYRMDLKNGCFYRKGPNPIAYFSPFIYLVSWFSIELVVFLQNQDDIEKMANSIEPPKIIEGQ